MTTLERIRKDYRSLQQESAKHPEWIGHNRAVNHWRIAKDQQTIRRLIGAGLLRIRIAPDEDCSWDNLVGDCFDIEVNASSIPNSERTIKAQEKRFQERIEQDGVWGIIAEYRARPCAEHFDRVISCQDSDFAGRCTGWNHGGSCWGFDYESACDPQVQLDIALEAMDQLKKTLMDRCPTCRKARSLPC